MHISAVQFSLGVSWKMQIQLAIRTWFADDIFS